MAGLSYREGTAADLEGSFTLSERAVYEAAVRHGLMAGGGEPSKAQIRADWQRRRPLIEFIAAQPDGRYLLCEEAAALVGYARVVRFGEVEELTELMVAPTHQGRGVGHGLLERCWPDERSGERARLVIAAGAPADLSLYGGFGVMPVAGHWHMRLATQRYLEARAAELEEPAASPAHVLEPAHAVAEWQRLEPDAIGHRRSGLHEFFARDRSCLACLDDATGVASSLCWVSSEGEIGPAVAAWPRQLPAIVIGALDRVARAQGPEYVSVFATTTAWDLLRRLRGLGFRVWWPSWIMSSLPLPGLDRYVPTRPPHLL